LPGSISVLNPNGTRPLGNIGDVYQYESSGRFDQNQWFIGFNNRFNRTIQFSANYSLSKTKNDTDGGGSFPVNSYDFTGEYGRAGFDIRHRFSFFGTINLPWQVSLSPLVNYFSGRPFNIITGQDTNLDRQFTERPSFAPAGVDCTHPAPNIICTPFGNFNRNPAPGEALIPRNFGQGPSFLGVNMRISKTWSFGSTASSRAASQNAKGKQEATQATDTGRGGGRGDGPGGIPRIPGGEGGGGGGPRGGGGEGGRGGGMGGGGMGGIGVPGGGGAEAKRYTMQFSVNFQNIFNHVNLSNPVGNLSSPSFGQSLSLNSGFGGFGGGGGGFGGGSSGAGNRRVSAQVRFNF
jgi:hypothetical protein